MKLLAGTYKLPDMFPKSFILPGGYKLTNTNDNQVWVSLTTALQDDSYFSMGIKDSASCVLFLEEDTFLHVNGEVEITPYLPEEK